MTHHLIAATFEVEGAVAAPPRTVATFEELDGRAAASAPCAIPCIFCRAPDPASSEDLERRASAALPCTVPCACRAPEAAEDLDRTITAMALCVFPCACKAPQDEPDAPSASSALG